MTKEKKNPRQPKRNIGKPGPTPDTLKFESGGRDALKKAFRKNKPQSGWPK
jgi:hypothetical protein